MAGGGVVDLVQTLNFLFGLIKTLNPRRFKKNPMKRLSPETPATGPAATVIPKLPESLHSHSSVTQPGAAGDDRKARSKIHFRNM